MIERLSLRSRFMAPMIFLIILGMGALSTVSYIKSKHALESSIQAQIDQIAASTLGIIKSWLKDRKLDLSNWSRQNIFATSLKESFVGKAARKSANEQLAQLKKDYTYYENICLADKNGDLLAAADERVVGKLNVKNRQFFKPSLEGKIAVSHVVKSRDTGNPVFFIASPVKEKDTITGVLFGVVDLSAFSREFIDTVKVGASGYAYLYQADGSVIAHPEKSNILKLNMNEFDFGRKMLAQGSGTMLYTFKGVEKLVVFKTDKDLGWTVGVGASPAEILAPVRSVGYTNAGIGALVVVLAAILILLLVNSLVKPLFRLSKGLGDAALQVSSASGQVAASSQSLAEGASEQAAAIEETSSSLEEIASMTKQNAGNASQANSLATETKATTESCSGTMEEMAAAIGEVSESARETQKIVKVIDEIAFQTNLLALNAAVEAARAGEAGAGFAVVADEVRNLALRAAEAARNTTERIEDINKKVNGSMEMVSKTVDEFGKVDENTKKVSELVAEIAAASNEQAQGIDQVNNAVAEMDKIVQRNAASAQETASASEEMSAQAEEMQGFVRELNATVGGRKGEDVHGQAPDRFAGEIMKVRKRAQGSAPLLSAPKGGARAMTVRSRKKATPEEIIPLKEDEFEDF